MTKSYSELIQIYEFEDRLSYLRLRGEVGRATFGFDRYLNQRFYRSREWHQVRQFVITRDNGLDLGVPGYEIYERPLIHHMNPLTVEQLDKDPESALDPDFLITTCLQTHNIIHYGDNRVATLALERQPGDTRLW